MDMTMPLWRNVRLRRDARGKLLDAITEHNYPMLYACLRKETEPFPTDEAYQICSLAVRSGCSLKAFQTILEHCVPLEDFVDYGDHFNHLIHAQTGTSGGLVQEAAAYGQSHILKYLLDQGCSPNARAESNCSALEAALWHDAVGCVAVLEQRDEVDFTITETILEIWSAMGMVPERDVCLRIIAGRLLGEKKGTFHREIPLLPGLNVLHGAKQENWPLLLRLCRETTVTEQQGKQVIDLYMNSGVELDVPECARLLDALFTACPGLLRCEYPRYVFALCMLAGEESDVTILRPWVARMPGKLVVLAGRRLAEREYDIVACLSRWEERMGTRLRPALRRNKLLPVRSMAQADDGSIRVLLENCAIRGTPSAGKVSRLAMDVLRMASPDLLAELCERGILFQQEDFTAVLEDCENLPATQRLQKRNILLAFGKKRVDYDL